MARNVKHAGKVDGTSAIHAQETGPTLIKNDPAKFHGAGKTHGKTPANGVIEQGHGAIFHCNETHIPTMNADKPPRDSKSIGEKGGLFKPVEEAGHLTASQVGSGGPTDREYPLRKEYDKRGRTIAKEPKKVF
jgi:hypothetical protein